MLHMYGDSICVCLHNHVFRIYIFLAANRWVEGSNTGWGWDQFLSLAELRKSYLDKKDTLNVEVEFEVVSATKYSTII